ncbi:MAG: sodium:solute symporter family protein, partial [Thermoanaerobaculia bacterium]
FSAVLAFPGVEPDSIVPYILVHVDLWPVLVGLVCAGTLAASMSSGDSILHAAASIAVCDGLAKAFPRTFQDDARERLSIRVLVVVLSVIAFMLAIWTETGLVSLLLGAYGGVAQIFPLMFAAFYWPRATGAGALAGLIAGLSVNTVFLLRPEWSPIEGVHEGIWGLVANVAALITVSLLTRPEPAETVRAYVEA